MDENKDLSFEDMTKAGETSPENDAPATNNADAVAESADATGEASAEPAKDAAVTPAETAENVGAAPDAPSPAAASVTFDTPAPPPVEAPCESASTATRPLFYPLFAAKKNYARLSLAVCLMFAAVQLVAIVCSALLRLFAPAVVEAPWFAVVFSIVAVYLIGAPVFLLTLRGTQKLPPPKTKMAGKQFWLAALMMFGVSYLANYAGTILIRLIDNALGLPYGSDLTAAVIDCPLWILLLCTVVIAPIGEELLFRRAICDRAAAFGEWQAMLLSGLLFALYHGSAEQFFYTLPLGAFLAFLYIRTGRVKYTIFLHALFNLVGTLPSVLLTRYTDIDGVLAALDGSQSLDFIVEHLGVILLYFGYAMLIFGVALAGFILFCVNLKKMRAATLPSAMPKRARFKILCGNAGFWVLAALWVLMVALNAILPILAEALQ